MEIKVERNKKDEDLVFTITVSGGHKSPLTVQEYLALTNIDEFTKTMEGRLSRDSDIFKHLLDSNHDLKEKIFVEILDNLKFAIENQLRPKFKPICQEIYNWIYDYQEGYVKSWMSDFDPQRTTYYFDNDEKIKNMYEQSSEIVVDDSDDDSDFDDEDEDG